jgi:hypothetical protein
MQTSQRESLDALPCRNRIGRALAIYRSGSSLQPLHGDAVDTKFLSQL